MLITLWRCLTRESRWGGLQSTSSLQRQDIKKTGAPPVFFAWRFPRPTRILHQYRGGWRWTGATGAIYGLQAQSLLPKLHSEPICVLSPLVFYVGLHGILVHISYRRGLIHPRVNPWCSTTLLVLLNGTGVGIIRGCSQLPCPAGHSSGNVICPENLFPLC
jgi:hypothetical protein